MSTQSKTDTYYQAFIKQTLIGIRNNNPQIDTKDAHKMAADLWDEHKISTSFNACKELYDQQK